MVRRLQKKPHIWIKNERNCFNYRNSFYLWINQEEPLLNGETESGSESSLPWPLYWPKSHFTAESTNASLPACTPYVPMCSRRGEPLQYSIVLSAKMASLWGYNSTMQCLLNPVFKQLFEWVWRGQTFTTGQTAEWSWCLHFNALQLHTILIDFEWEWNTR